ncbi:SET domain-containing protein [Fragilariopsis cylindrus CCMP1102]|uniref:SET domain-containing protein n=1 Tax=Fragilariopsis cylindrus CCMP1102 TaxID=635003 RepID=A0A1E7FEL5_9STRA|nr:SET domain-containing protein [Fragilariopsis cylindrus CCMP1102]|eukprot:OEU16495.1 SET domain-containing protein [Fragilariopsis cylindrus CCMP1102]
MAKPVKKKKKKIGNNNSSGGGLKGFGSVGGSTKDKQVDIDRSNEARLFYDYMEEGGAGDNFSRCVIGNLPLNNEIKIRGIVALKPIKKGDTIIRIPYEQAVNFGQEGSDPTLPAVAFLKDYCETLASSSSSSTDEVDAIENKKISGKASYYQMLPKFQGEDCMSSTGFFSDRALTELQYPLIVEETEKRKERICSRFQSDIANNENFPKWLDGSPIIEDQLAWAVWLITSRVLTVQGDAEEGKSYRLLIPFLDMCNHDRSSPHVLTGRAVPGGELKVVAGASIKEGDAINIGYGGGVAGNDRFLQDYGFLDTSSNNAAYNMVAQQLLGKRRIVEGIGSGYLMSESDRLRTIEQLNLTTLEDDMNLLEEEIDSSIIAAYNYRIGVKNALSKFDDARK